VRVLFYVFPSKAHSPEQVSHFARRNNFISSPTHFIARRTHQLKVEFAVRWMEKLTCLNKKETVNRGNDSGQIKVFEMFEATKTLFLT